jgi:hypothetical protein
MQTPILLAGAALVATATATGLVAPGHIAHMRRIEARQTATAAMSAGASVPPCVTALISAYSSFPTIPAEIESYASANPMTDPCSYSIPTSLSSAVMSYETQVLSWYGKLSQSYSFVSWKRC